MIIANMSKSPQASLSMLESSISSIASQVDMLNVCLNNLRDVPAFCLELENVNAFVPSRDYGAAGRYISRVADDDEVLYVTDTIVYPRGYVEYARDLWAVFESLNPIIGFGGKIYPDVYNGLVEAWIEFPYTEALSRNRIVNELHGGTVYCKGWQAPLRDTMDNAAGFSDVRLASHAYQNEFPMICAAHPDAWIRDIATDLPGENSCDSVKNSTHLELPIIREIQAFAGFGRLNRHAVETAECQA